MGFLGSSDRIMDRKFSPVISTSDSKELHLKTKFGKTLSLFFNDHFAKQCSPINIGEHCLAKWSLKIFIFSFFFLSSKRYRLYSVTTE